MAVDVGAGVVGDENRDEDEDEDGRLLSWHGEPWTAPRHRRKASEPRMVKPNGPPKARMRKQKGMRTGGKIYTSRLRLDVQAEAAQQRLRYSYGGASAASEAEGDPIVWP